MTECLHKETVDMKDVHLFVLNTMADWEPSFAIAHINRPMPGMASAFRVRTVGDDQSPVRSMGGLAIAPELSLSQLQPGQSAMLILPGADLWGDASTDPALAKAREFVEGRDSGRRDLRRNLRSGTGGPAGRPAAYRQRPRMACFKWIPWHGIIQSRTRG